jgi:hypothetical protein
MGAKAWIAVGAVALMGISLATDDGSADPNDPSTRDTAMSACHSAVTTQLRSPATAHFHDEDAMANADKTGLVVAGKVDSQNAYGATLTALWICNTDTSGNLVGTPYVEAEG